MGMHDAVGVNGPHAPRQDFDLGLAQLAVQRMELAVDVADADIVQIHQGQLANAGAGQGFDRPRADPAQANDANMGAPAPLKPFLPVTGGQCRRSAFHSGA